MTTDFRLGEKSEDDLTCLGTYIASSPICKERCALRVRCIVAREQNARMELLEELTAVEMQAIKIQ